MDDPTLRAILVLTARLSNADGKALNPLRPTEWDKLASFLFHHLALEPSRLLEPGVGPVLAEIEASLPKISRERLDLLLRRADHVDRKVNEWNDQDIWILRRHGPDYPRHLCQKLGASVPPILFGGGGRHLLSEPGVAIVGSRDAEYAELQRATDLGAMVAAAGLTVISGGARGVDERAVEGALMAGGRAVVVVPDSLASNLRKRQFASYIGDGRLALVSRYSPDAGYQTGSAMGRNPLIYCLSDAAFVVHSAKHAGGTFAGAKEALEGQWTRVWVDGADNPTSGNRVLHEEFGADWLPSDPLNLLDDLRQAHVELGSSHQPQPVMAAAPVE